MPDHETATPSDGGCGARTRDLLLAKAQHTVHQGDTNGTASPSEAGSAAAAATRHRTPTESLHETHAAGTCIVCDGLIRWDELERNARALDRSEACHTLRVRAAQAIGQQRHVRAAVSHIRRAVGA